MVQQAFQFINLGTYLSVNTRQPGNPLFASASSVGPNELFEVESLTAGSSLCVMKASNGLYLGYTPLVPCIGANATIDTAIQFVQIVTQSNQVSLIVTGLDATTGLVVADTNSTPPNLIVMLPLDTSGWPNEYAMLQVTGYDQ